MSMNSSSTSHLTNAKHVIADAANRLDGVQVFLFGSSRFTENPSDIDLLFVYDQSKIAPNEAHARFRPIICELERATGIPVRPVVITLAEERDTGFIESVKPTPITIQEG